MVRDLSVLQTVNENLGPLDLLIRRRRPHHRSLVGGGGRASFHNLVARGNEILFRNQDIRECSVHHDPDLSEPLKASRHRHAEVVDELLIEEMADAIHVVLILEDSREFSDDLFFFSSCIVTSPFPVVEDHTLSAAKPSVRVTNLMPSPSFDATIRHLPFGDGDMLV
jgi:hypothetical protein